MDCMRASGETLKQTSSNLPVLFVPLLSAADANSTDGTPSHHVLHKAKPFMCCLAGYTHIGFFDRRGHAVPAVL